MTPETKAILDWVLGQNIDPKTSAPVETADRWFARNAAEVGEDQAMARATAKASRWKAAYEARA